jgi:hypothetical protein
MRLITTPMLCSALTRTVGSRDGSGDRHLRQLTKIDVKAAFRCVPVHPSDRWLLCMKWCNSFYADLALPFGLKSSPGIRERYATL